MKCGEDIKEKELHITQFQQKMVVSNSQTWAPFPFPNTPYHFLGHHRQEIHPAKTKLSSLCFAELELKEKGGSQEGKWVSKEIERAAVLWCIAPSLSGRAY